MQQALIIQEKGTEYAILSNGRFFVISSGRLKPHNALEATLVDPNYDTGGPREWLNEKNIQDRILWLSQVALYKADNETVKKVFLF